MFLGVGEAGAEELILRHTVYPFVSTSPHKKFSDTGLMLHAKTSSKGFH